MHRFELRTFSDVSLLKVLEHVFYFCHLALVPKPFLLILHVLPGENQVKAVDLLVIPLTSPSVSPIGLESSISLTGLNFLKRFAKNPVDVAELLKLFDISWLIGAADCPYSGISSCFLLRLLILPR